MVYTLRRRSHASNQSVTRPVRRYQDLMAWKTALDGDTNITALCFQNRIFSSWGWAIVRSFSGVVARLRGPCHVRYRSSQEVHGIRWLETYRCAWFVSPSVCIIHLTHIYQNIYMIILLIFLDTISCWRGGKVAHEDLCQNLKNVRPEKVILVDEAASKSLILANYLKFVTTAKGWWHSWLLAVLLGLFHYLS